MKILIPLNELKELKSRALIPLECEHCKITFHGQKNKILGVLKNPEYKKFKFCSSSCANKSRITRVDKKCHHCQAEINLIKSDEKDRNFCSRDCSSKFYGSLRKKPEKTKRWPLKGERVPRFEKNCSSCNTPLLRTKAQISYSKTQTFFCSKTCKASYLHKFQIKFRPRSKAELYLSELIKSNFPDLEVMENVRNILSDNLEIDIFIPSLKLCIELNGPVHYFPIWGEDKLKNVQNKDIKKQIEIQKLKMNLIVIDISKLTSKKKTIDFLDSYFESHIKPLLSI